MRNENIEAVDENGDRENKPGGNIETERLSEKNELFGLRDVLKNLQSRVVKLEEKETKLQDEKLCLKIEIAEIKKNSIGGG